ncbi:hypothetical protein Cni_G19247 [Canna indica]|uniref:K Homology domain-containing protein n=1 Tax=Canna indica TaxID=4628 RepID=A0AAQ3KM49_9LILI|nr:hypothetical protein Cni_G19247 [Canna indica]
MAAAPVDTVEIPTIDQAPAVAEAEAPASLAAEGKDEKNAGNEEEEEEEDPEEEDPDEISPDEAVVEEAHAAEVAPDVDVAEEAHAKEVAQDEVLEETDAEKAEPPLQGNGGGAEVKKWPGWPGDNVFRLIVPLLKVGSIIGRKGELIKKLCEETRARVRILQGPIGVSDRIVLISGKEELEAEISPAMHAVLRICKHVNGILDNADDGTNSGSAAPGICLVRLLVASSQAMDLIGKKGEVIRSIQESSDATVRVLTGGELPFYASAEERIVVIQGEPFKVLKALEAVVKRLRKFLVDHSILPLFEKSYNTPVAQDESVTTWGENKSFMNHTGHQSTISNDYDLPIKRDSSSLDGEYAFDSKRPRGGLALYGQDSSVSALYSSALRRPGNALEITQKMQIPIEYAETIIGVTGENIARVRRTSGALVTVQETRGFPDEITVEIKGTSSQVHCAQELIQQFLVESREPASHRYGESDRSLRSSYSHLADASYTPSSSLGPRSFARYSSYVDEEYAPYRF